ncbi:hypothetical protein LPJ61_002530 [Coemansia biformis]|uniref:TATA element modulatory factor 1 TATA binding domain-containing protein n=1 Tax=Coemansia biformis TaxID=1286918 RepID=A0A9W7YCB1_9FUNG|nr:hypothetical protein LPJ61_002530 [Coemansia biformis]
MNSLFGAGPDGPVRQAAAKGTAAAVAPAGPAAAPGEGAAASGSAGRGGWGTLFKSALNQMETHLDRYLEIPNEGHPGDDRRRQQQQQQRQHQPPRAARNVHEQPRAQQSTSLVSSPPAAIPDRHSQRAVASSDGLQRKPSVALRNADKQQQQQQPGLAAAASSENDMNASLLDAFGIDLDGGSAPVAAQPRQAADPVSAERPASPVPRSSAGTPAPAHPEELVADCGMRTGHPDSAARQESTSEAEADNPYIQEELKKLRAALIPSNPDDMRKMIDEYARRIEALLLEGQAWSAKELRLSNTVKKLRTDSRGPEKAAQLAQRNLEAAQSRNEGLNERLKRASLSDRATADSTRAMRTRIQEAHERQQQLEYELRVANETRSSLGTALASAESEMAALRSELATARAQQDKSVQRAQMDAQADADRRVAAVSRETSRERQRLQAHIDELRQRMLVVEEECREREVLSLTQIRALRAQLRGVEAQDREAGGEIRQHTLPLLQQIEEIQARQAGLRSEWARKEDEWAARVRDSAKGAEKLQAQLEQQLAAGTARVAEAAAAECRRADDARAEVTRLSDQLRTEAKIRADMKQQLEEARGTAQRLSAKVASMAGERAAPSESSSRSGLSPQGLSPVGLAGDGPGAGHTRSPSLSSVSSTDSRPRRGSSADALAAPADGGGAAHAATKKLSSQITSLKAQLQTALRQKNEYSRSLVELSVQAEALRTEAAAHSSLRQELDALAHRHGTALEMLGEKTEELADLRADMDEMKQIYQQQLLQSLLPEK